MDQWIAINQETCLFCAEPLLLQNHKDSVKDHCHITEKYRGAVHNQCNFKLRLNAKTVPIPVVFHNLKGYDGHLLIQAMSRVQGEIKCIPNNTENYISFSLGNLRFIDSVNFLLSSLDSLVKGGDPMSFKITKKMYKDEEKLLLKKGIYTYEYMNCFERFGETKLPAKEAFYSKPNGKRITEEEYEHAQKVWEAFGCKTLGDYHDLYVTTDMLLLADVFENFRKVCMGKYGLDPAHYFSSPGLSWDALLKRTGVELELLTDQDMHLFIERGMRGGISMVSKYYAKANNPRVEGYDPPKPTNYITYLDANNLYGLPLPKSGFNWKRVMPTQEQIMKMKENSRVDSGGGPGVPRRAARRTQQLPTCAGETDHWKGDDVQLPKVFDERLEFGPAEQREAGADAGGQKQLRVHYKNLQFYLRQGMRLKKVHRAIEFDQERWMEPYIKLKFIYRAP